jgi:hypothetical protein
MSAPRPDNTDELTTVITLLLREPKVPRQSDGGHQARDFGAATHSMIQHCPQTVAGASSPTSGPPETLQVPCAGIPMP